MIQKNLGALIFIFFLLLVSPLEALAQAPSFSFYPKSGTVKDSSKGFTVDILLDSASESITKARFAVKFDPRQIQIVKASRNNSLFDQWPEDESTIDNSRGMVMLTGFTQSGGEKDLYVTQGDPDVLARLEFEVITEENDDIVLEFEYSGTDELFKSVIMKDGSPPQNALVSKPNSATFSLTGYRSPNTAIEPSHIGVVAGLLLIAVGIFVRGSKPSIFRKKRGTLVFYE